MSVVLSPNDNFQWLETTNVFGDGMKSTITLQNAFNLKLVLFLFILITVNELFYP